MRARVEGRKEESFFGRGECRAGGGQRGGEELRLSLIPRWRISISIAFHHRLVGVEAVRPVKGALKGH
jgi:hypothetical protein